jgi:predicted LPLAT superfamily acyltransferase
VAASACKGLGRAGCLTLLAPAVLVFLLIGADQRRASRDFLARARGRRASLWTVYLHFMSFAARAVDSFRAWIGDIPPGAVLADTPEALARLMADRGGALLVVAHFGNVDLARALLDDATRARLTILVHTRHAVNYNRLLREFRPAAALNLIQVSEIGPETAIDLQQRIERGEWIVIAGDRTPVSGGAHASFVPFLGRDAAFSHGPWILAALLRCPVHLLFCVRVGGHWRLTLEHFADSVVLGRKDRRERLSAHAAAYAKRLETRARAFPLQWYNFFDFWAR